jgi:hypothetical protein
MFGRHEIDMKRVTYPCCDDEVNQVGFLDHALALDVVCVEILAELGEGHVLQLSSAGSSDCRIFRESPMQVDSILTHQVVDAPRADLRRVESTRGTRPRHQGGQVRMGAAIHVA